MKNTKKHLHQEKNSDWVFLNLSEQLLPYVHIDYLSLSCLSGVYHWSLLNQFQKLKPDLRHVIFFSDNKEDQETEELKLKKKYFRKTTSQNFKK